LWGWGSVYLRQRLEFLDCCRVECSRVTFEVTEAILAFDTSFFFGSSDITLGQIARVDLANRVVVQSNRCNIGLRLELNDVFAGNDTIRFLAC
jgi:hypothetical protein